MRVLSLGCLVLAVVLAAAPAQADPSVCGNGKRDPTFRAVCPPCMPGHSCPACGMSKTGMEQCDGKDLGGASCRGFGYGGGHLSCSASCELDFSGCTWPKPTASRTIVDFDGKVGPWSALAVSHGVLGVVTTTQDEKIRFARYDARTLRLLAPAVEVPVTISTLPNSMGSHPLFYVGIAPLGDGFVIAGSGSSSQNSVQLLLVGKKGPPQPSRSIENAELEFLEPGAEGPLLGLSVAKPRDHLELQLLGLDGKPVGQPAALQIYVDRPVRAVSRPSGWTVVASVFTRIGVHPLLVTQVSRSGAIVRTDTVAVEHGRFALAAARNGVWLVDVARGGLDRVSLEAGHPGSRTRLASGDFGEAYAAGFVGDTLEAVAISRRGPGRLVSGGRSEPLVGARRFTVTGATFADGALYALERDAMSWRGAVVRAR